MRACRDRFGRSFGKAGVAGNGTDEFVTAFIPDPEPNPDTAGTTAAEGVATDGRGNIYGAEVGPRALKKYVRARRR